VSCTNRPVRVTDSWQWAHIQFCSPPWNSYSPGSVQVPKLLQLNSRIITRQEDHAHFPSVLPNSWVIIPILLDADIQLRLCHHNDNTQHETYSVYHTNLTRTEMWRRYTISYTFWHFLSAIITESLYRLSCAFRTGPQCEAQSFANTLK
jgi:hypothetical protein